MVQVIGPAREATGWSRRSNGEGGMWPALWKVGEGRETVEWEAALDLYMRWGLKMSLAGVATTRSGRPRAARALEQPGP